MSKSSNRRKSAAIVLAVLGVAGLSLASASQLNLTSTNSGILQAGTAVVTGACQTSTIAVSFTPTGSGTLGSGTSFGYSGTADQLVLTSADTACAGKKMKVALGTSAGAAVGAEYSTTGLVAGVQTIALSTAFGVLDANQVNSIKKVSVTIFD